MLLYAVTAMEYEVNVTDQTARKKTNQDKNTKTAIFKQPRSQRLEVENFILVSVLQYL